MPCIVPMQGMGWGAATAAADLLSPTPTNPAQSLASSATSFSVEWTHAGAPAGTTYAVACIDQDENAVTASSGSGLGPYVFSGSAGEAYVAEITATGTDGQVAKSRALVQIAATATAGWEEVADYDFTGLDAATLTGTGNVQKGGVNYGPAFKVVDHSSNLGTVTAGSTGVTINGLNINSALNCSFNIGAVLPRNPLLFPVWVDIVLAEFGELTGGSDGLRAGVVDSGANFSAGNANAVRADYISATTWNIKTETVASGSATSSSWLGTETANPSNVVSLLIVGGMVVQAFMQRNTKTRPSSTTIDAGGRVCARTIAAGASLLFPATDFYIGAGVIWRTKVTIESIRVHQMGAQ